MTPLFDLSTDAGISILSLINGGGEDDRLKGEAGNDHINGWSGADTISGLGGADILHGGRGADLLRGGFDSDFLYGGSDNDVLFGGPGADWLFGGHGADTLSGREGDDILAGDSGADVLDGGAGEDAVSCESTGAAVVIDLARGRVHGDGPDVLISIEDAYGGAGSDLIIGSSGSNFIDGLQGADTLIGGAGNDSLNGYSGRDVLIGGAGIDNMDGGEQRDTFVFRALSDSSVATPDTIDNLALEDRIDLHRIDADATQAGDQAFVRVSALDGHAGELAVFFDSGTNSTLLQADVDGDGVSDMTIAVSGDHVDFTHFVL